MSNTVIYHRADYDGLFSAAICKLYLPDDTTFIGWDFGDPLIEFPAEGQVYLVDLPPDCFATLPIGLRRLIWIDHHKSSIQKWDDELGHPFSGYRIDGVAACRLCYQWFTKHRGILPHKDMYLKRRVQEPLAIRMAGEYDVWDHRDPYAVAFQFGLQAKNFQLKDIEPLLRYISGDRLAENLSHLGREIQNWQEQFAESVVKDRCYVREFEGIKFAVLASSHVRNSMWFPDRALPNEAEALMAWRYDGNVVSFSLYHRPRHEHHDLSQIAVKYGGGGHKGACGFQLPLDEALEIVR